MKQLLLIFQKFNIHAEMVEASEKKYGKLPNVEERSEFQTQNIFCD
jgi:hypothetical protein